MYKLDLRPTSLKIMSSEKRAFTIIEAAYLNTLAMGILERPLCAR